MSARIELFSVVLIAIAVLVGGRTLLLDIAHQHGPALLVLAMLLFVQFAAMRRNYAQGGSFARVRATRDVAFIAALIFAMAVVLSPQRWSIGSTIVAVEMGLVLETLKQFSVV
jgi:hypothetical protein